MGTGGTEFSTPFPDDTLLIPPQRGYDQAEPLSLCLYHSSPSGRFSNNKFCESPLFVRTGKLGLDAAAIRAPLLGDPPQSIRALRVFYDCMAFDRDRQGSIFVSLRGNTDGVAGGGAPLLPLVRAGDYRTGRHQDLGEDLFGFHFP
ncbi:MAG: hypothetical protein BWY93_00595 [Euryarchaeota archaeon ADurb.BinA087]|nr:MAG: hypothetical protein BWY93_00595 [Euryarchaeota archaeon ADurb.BinA087]